MNIKLADRLVALRKERGFSQEELADRLGISRQAVSKWEQALSSPDLDNLVRLAQLYGLTLDELVCVDAPPAAKLPQGAVDGAGERSGESARLSVGIAPAAPPLEAENNAPGREASQEPCPVPSGAEPGLDPEATVKRRQPRNWSWLYIVPYPVITVLVFLILGFGWGLWHPGWVVFLTIPVYYAAVTGLAERRPNPLYSPCSPFWSFLSWGLSFTFGTRAGSFYWQFPLTMRHRPGMRNAAASPMRSETLTPS